MVIWRIPVRTIEYDAQTLPGNSGGPIFNPVTGDVVGVVRSKIRGTTEVNLATSSALVLIPFLAGNDVAVGESSKPDSRPIVEAPPLALQTPGVAITESSHDVQDGAHLFSTSVIEQSSAKIDVFNRDSGLRIFVLRQNHWVLSRHKPRRLKS